MTKRKRHEQKRGVCVYCGAEGPITSEHVFAKRLFLIADEEMVVAPACEPCNTRKELGDKDLHLYVTLHVGGSQHPDAYEHARRIAEKSNVRTKQWLRRSIADADEVSFVTEAGIEVSRGIAFPFNDARIIETLEMSIRGLYHYETKTMLPPDYPVFVHEVPWSQAPTYAARRGDMAPFKPTVKGNHVAWWKSFPVADMPPESRSWVGLLQ